MESCSFRPATAPSPFPSAPSSSSASSLRTPRPNLRFPRPRNRRKIGVRRRASGFDAFPPLPGKVFVDEAIGAEYGEGFETFRMDGPLKIDVDYLNEKLQECFLQRIRHAMKPDEAFGLIFSWDNVIADTDSLKLDAWRQLALEEGKDIPSAAHIRKSILHGAADHVLRKVFCIGQNRKIKWKKMKARLIELYYENLFEVSVSCYEGMLLLHYYYLLNYVLRIYWSNVCWFFSPLQLDRKPSKCVVFEDDPRGVTAAHNCTMMAVALIGAHPAYELVQADLAIAKYSKLSVINLRRLFANKGISFMDLQKQISEKSPPNRRLTVDTIF
nr:unnamed protein product [Digitaria exilis]